MSSAPFKGQKPFKNSLSFVSDPKRFRDSSTDVVGQESREDSSTEKDGKRYRLKKRLTHSIEFFTPGSKILAPLGNASFVDWRVLDTILKRLVVLKLIDC